MVRTLNKLTLQKNPYFRADGVNAEGFPTFHRSAEEQYLQMLLTNTLSGTFYATETALLESSLGLHQQMAAQSPDFMARALVYARNQGLMRLQPIVGLVYLAKADRDLFRRIFGQIILTPGDLTDFVEIVRGGVTPGGMGRAIKSAINAWLNGMSEYHAIKYATGGQGYSLRDVLRVTHPKPITPVQDAIFIWLTDHEKWAAAEKAYLTPQIAAFEQLKQAEKPKEVRRLIEQGRLPYEVVTGVTKPDVETWVKLMQQMPYFALLRHLNTLQRAGVLREGDHARYVAKRLRDADSLKKARILPFRLFMAHTMFQPQEAEEKLIATALMDALEASFVNMPNLGGRVAIAPDVSGSMGSVINKQSRVRYCDIAGIFTGALVKASENAVVLPFENTVISIKLSRREKVMVNAEKIRQMGGGGTAISAPISELLHEKTVVDTFIGITDNVEWASDQWGGLGFLPVWREYKQKVAPKAKAFLITIAPYNAAVAPQAEPDVHYIYGWNDNVLPYIAMQVAGLGGQLEAVQKLDI